VASVELGLPGVVDLLMTHPKLLVGGMLLDNPYYLTADEFIARRQ
jgi:hypothetical protein